MITQKILINLQYSNSSPSRIISNFHYLKALGDKYIVSLTLSILNSYIQYYITKIKYSAQSCTCKDNN